MRGLEMPANFSWLIENVLAGSGQIGGWGYDDQLQNDLNALRERGIGVVISLTESPLQADLVEARGMAYFHLPVPDMHPPGLQDIIAFIQYVEQSVAEGRPVLVHCSAGLGRTGTMLASYLVYKGSNTVDALAQIRAMRPGSVETPDQELAVYDYEVYLGTKSVSS
ncbi:MAG: protein phosphatase [Gemmatimonadetes bacterium]|nr:protein phosphatase [Gemmatimonadota bacterium]|tara:strand:- start:1128 stop:1625 length:498 start_codon:yes stop_codon:yes gene_type:complete